MCYWPKEDPKYDLNKSRAENYQILRKLFEDEAKNVDRSRTTGGSSSDLAKRMLEKRIFKGAHLDWNYTEMLRDLIEQGLVKVPITEFDVAFVEWASGSLDEVENSFYKGEKALFDWENKKWPGYDKIGRWGNPEWFNKRNDLAEAHFYNDSNREEFISTPATKEPNQPTIPVEQQSADTPQATAQQQPIPVQYSGNQYIVPTQQQNKSWIPNVDYVDPNFIPEWEEQLMMKEALMGAQGRALMQQMGMVPQYQPPQYQTVQPAVPQPPRFTSPEQVVSYILANQPELVYDQITDESINNALEGTFIGADEQ